jgi:hypothetical protein
LVRIEEEQERLAAECGCRLAELIGPLGDPLRARQTPSRKAPPAAPNADVVVPVLDYGDRESARLIGLMSSRPGVQAVARLDGPFHDLPLSSLHVYHGPDVHFLRVSSEVASPR